MALALMAGGCAEAGGTESTSGREVATADETGKQSPEGCKLVFYSAQNCEPCSKVKAFWPDLAIQIEQRYPGLKVSETDCDAPENLPMCDSDPMLGGYPAILLHLPDGTRIEYESRFEPDAVWRFLAKQFG